MVNLEANLHNVFIKQDKTHLRNGNQTYSCAYLTVDNRDRVTPFPLKPCHASLLNGDLRRSISTIYTSCFIRSMTDVPNATRWYEFIFRPDGPWRNAAKDAELFTDDNGAPLYCKLNVSDDVTYHEFMNLIHYTREPFEHQNTIDLWCDVQDDYGLDEIEAFVVTQGYCYNTRGQVARQTKGHSFVNPGRKLSIKKLRNGLPLATKVRNTFKAGDRFSMGKAVNETWCNTSKNALPIPSSILCKAGPSVFPRLEKNTMNYDYHGFVEHKMKEYGL